MFDQNRLTLEGVVEIDESSMRFHGKNDDKRFGTQGRSNVGKLIILGAVELKDDGRGAGRIRLQAAKNFTRETLHAFTLANTVTGSHISTDGNTAYRGLPDRDHTEQVIRDTPAHLVMPWIHRVFANLKRFALGVYHGFRRNYLQAYLDEFVFRWNRRRHYKTSFDTLVGIGIRIGPTPLNLMVHSPS
jgi:hypothetical protein